MESALPCVATVGACDYCWFVSSAFTFGPTIDDPEAAAAAARVIYCTISFPRSISFSCFLRLMFSSSRDLMSLLLVVVYTTFRLTPFVICNSFPRSISFHGPPADVLTNNVTS